MCGLSVKSPQAHFSCGLQCGNLARKKSQGAVALQRISVGSVESAVKHLPRYWKGGSVFISFLMMEREREGRGVIT